MEAWACHSKDYVGELFFDFAGYEVSFTGKDAPEITLIVKMDEVPRCRQLIMELVEELEAAYDRWLGEQ